MDDKKKMSGWIVLGVIAVVAAVALAVTNSVTAGPIEERNLGEAQAALEAMFPEADAGAAGFEEMGDNGGLATVYQVKQNGQVIGYAFKETAQGYAGPVEVTVGTNMDMSLRGVTVGGSGFQETEGLGSKAKDPSFTNQFNGKIPPLTLGENIDAISGATVTSKAVVDGVNNGIDKLKTVAQGGQAGPQPEASPTAGPAAGPTAGPAARTANASVIGYGGPVLVTLGLDVSGAITSLEVGKTRFAETEGVGDKVKDEAFTAQFIGKTPPIDMSAVDAVSGATVSSKAVVDAVNEAAMFLNP